MKNNPAPVPARFTCRLVRGWNAVFGDGAAGEPRGFGAAHVAACAGCQQFFGASDDLTAALQRDAARARREAPAGLEQNILRAVKRAAPEPARSRAWLPLAVAAACVLVTTVVFQRQFFPGQPAVPAVASASVSPQELWNAFKPSAGAVLAGDPLQNEVDAVVADARTAVRFLARNFLPTTPERPTSID